LKISIIIEGKTEKAFLPFLRKFLETRLAGIMPRLDPLPYDGPIPKRDKLRRVVENLFRGRNGADHVIALTDIYTGATPPDFISAQDAKQQMRQWVGKAPRFHPHAAQYDFEAWLLPYWPTIQRLAKHNKAAPAGDPETVDRNNPPSYCIKEIFEIGKCRDSYIKPRDAARILRENDLMVAIDACIELKALVNTILSVCGGEVIP
jgi:hypothetical protein